MIRFYDCDFCKHCTGMKKGHPVCEAFPNGVAYDHMDKDCGDWMWRLWRRDPEGIYN